MKFDVQLLHLSYSKNNTLFFFGQLHLYNFVKVLKKNRQIVESILIFYVSLGKEVQFSI